MLSHCCANSKQHKHVSSQIRKPVSPSLTYQHTCKSIVHAVPVLTSTPLQEEQCHRAMVVKALEQTMAIISPKNAFLGRKQVNLIAEKRPRTLEAFLSMSLHGLSKHMRTTHGPAIIETLRQVILLVLPQMAP